jgi:hypothetical protein
VHALKIMQVLMLEPDNHETFMRHGGPKAALELCGNKVGGDVICQRFVNKPPTQCWCKRLCAFIAAW